MGEIERAAPVISPALQEKGVGLVRSADGYTAITGLDALRNDFHVLVPVESVAQTDPFYVPSINTVRLNPQDHAYNEQGKLALNKNGLLLLAQAAGLGAPLTHRMQIADPDKVGWQATVTMRRADGTMMPYTASRVVTVSIEREKIKRQCLENGVIDQNKFFQRWSREADVLEAKVETKAILRAIREALAVRGGGYQARDFNKPFLVIAYNFRPDYSDPEIRRMAMQRGMGQTQALYGNGGGEELHQLPVGAPEPQVVPGVDVGVDARSLEDEELAELQAIEDAEVVSLVEPDAPLDPRIAIADEVAGVVMRAGKHEGKTIAEIGKEDPEWLRFVIANAKDAAMRERLQAYVDIRL